MKDQTKFLEFLGILIGDGCLLFYPKHRNYGIEIAGNRTQIELYNNLGDFLEKFTDKRPRLDLSRKNSAEAIRLVLYSKNFVNYLIHDVGIPHKNKTKTVTIPMQYIDWEYSKHIIKGIFEADGCLHFSRHKKGSIPSYPRLQIKSNSENLISQISQILNQQGFRSTVLKHKNGKNFIFSVYLSGEKNLNLWSDKIGFFIGRNKSKYLRWKKFKYSSSNLS
jgi:DNA-binding transcriptional regulator WhiA